MRGRRRRSAGTALPVLQRSAASPAISRRRELCRNPRLQLSAVPQLQLYSGAALARATVRRRRRESVRRSRVMPSPSPSPSRSASR